MSDEEVEEYIVFERNTLRWPKVGDKLLSVGRDTFIADCAGERNYRLLRGYKFAGDVLIQKALADICDRNNLVFPALFNYRHYIELALKAIIEDHGVFAGIDVGIKNHKLPALWKKFLEIAKKFNNDPLDQSAVAVGMCIDEFNKIDTSSTTFRYARNLEGDVHTLPQSLDLLGLHDVMNGIENFFECADMDFTHKSNLAYEAASYSRDIN